MSRFNTLTNSLIKLITSCFAIDPKARVHLSFNGKDIAERGRPVLKAEISTHDPVSAILSQTLVKETVEMWAHAVEIEYSHNNLLYIDILIESDKIVRYIIRVDGEEPVLTELLGKEHLN